MHKMRCIINACINILMYVYVHLPYIYIFCMFSLECVILLDIAESSLEFMIMLCGFADDTI